MKDFQNPFGCQVAQKKNDCRELKVGGGWQIHGVPSLKGKEIVTNLVSHLQTFPRTLLLVTREF